MAKKLPFPTEILLHPHTLRLSTSAYGIFVRLVVHYWDTGEALPESNNAIVRLSYSDHGAWGRHKVAIMVAYNALMPFLIERRDYLIIRLEKKRVIARIARNAYMDKVRLSKLAVSNLYDAVTEHMEITPVNSPGILQNTGQFDPVARKLAMQSAKLPKQKLTDE